MAHGGYDKLTDIQRAFLKGMGMCVDVDEAPKSKRTKKGTKEGLLRAFTVHPGWAWAILEGVKDREWRTFLPNPREGRCAITVSKSYSPSQWKNEVKWVRKEFGVELIPYDELVAEWCGKVVAVCDYAASEDDLGDNGFENGWRLSNVRPLKCRISCKGALKLWTMDADLSKKVLAAL